MSMFRKAERRKQKLRLAISGPSGSGKTYSALQVAFGIGGRVVVIDSERGSADLYEHLGEYDVYTMQPPYEPEKLMQVIAAAEREGYDTIIIDSLTHYWAGEGGLLERHDKMGGNSFTAWGKITPVQNKMVDAMLASKCHVIVTMRSKQEYVLTEKNGKQTPEKVGMSPEQRNQIEFEFTSSLALNMQHVSEVSNGKDRTGLFDGKAIVLSQDTGKQLLAWLETGADAPEPTVTNDIQGLQSQTAAKPSKTPIVAYGERIKALGFESAEAKQIVAQVTGKSSGFTAEDFAKLDEWIAKNTPPEEPEQNTIEGDGNEQG
ncbi:MAG: ATP-binding protein [bacterium]|nr:ATP-binding protein [bacterium]